ncbi:hypothetical protein ABTH54_19940, partial [Acinetobacter baumannii]
GGIAGGAHAADLADAGLKKRFRQIRHPKKKTPAASLRQALPVFSEPISCGPVPTESASARGRQALSA